MTTLKKFNLVLYATLILLVAASCNKNDDDNNLGTEPPIMETKRDIVTAVEHLGICYGPYHFDGQQPGTTIPKSQIESDLTLIAKNFKFLRTYTVADGMEQVIPVAASKGLQVAVGVHCYPNDASKTKADIDKAIQSIKDNKSAVLALIVGNETNLHGSNNVAPTTVADYMKYAKTKLTALNIDLPVTSCITGVGADNSATYGDQDYCGPILQQCKDLNSTENQIIVLTIYPYYGNGQPDNIAGNMQWSYEHGMSNAENSFGLTVIIGEIGWPTGANNNGTSTGRENVSFAKTNFSTTVSWVNGHNFKNTAYNAFWFEMFDEQWKTNEPNGIGPSWGLYKNNGAQTPKFPIPSLL